MHPISPPASRQDAFPIRALPPFVFCGEAPADRYFEVGKEQEEAFVGALSRRGEGRKPSVFWSRFMHSL